MIQNVKEWFAGLELRERRLVLTSAILLVIMLVYVAMWEPLVNKVDDLQMTTTQQHSVLMWMRQTANEVKKLRGNTGSRAKPPSGQSLLSLVDRTAKAGRLGPALKRVQPDGEQRVRVWMEAANFDDIINWLVQLETRHGVQVENSVFEMKEESGRVDARLVFEAAV